MLIEKRIPIKYIFGKIRKEIFFILLFSVFIVAAKFYFIEWLPKVPSFLPSVLGICISLIMAFRINQSYDRWWEARKVWGAIVNDSRSMIMQLYAFIDDVENQHNKRVYQSIANRQIAWCYSLGQSLRGLDPIKNVERYISVGDLNYITKQVNKPNALLMLQTRQIKELHSSSIINSYQHVQLDNTIVRLCDSMGKCERINSTVFPRTYSLMVHFFIYLFVAILSLGLVESMGVLEIPLLTIIASTFLLIEKTGIHMQDPFRNRPTDTSVTAIARTIEINIKQMIGETDVPEPYQPNDFYLM